MPITNVTNLSDIGIIKDVPAYSLPINAWSDGNNIAFREEGVQRVSGYTEIMASCPISNPYFVSFYQADDANQSRFFIAYGSNAIAIYDKAGDSWTTRTRQEEMALDSSYSIGVTSIVVNTASSSALSSLLPTTNGKLALGSGSDFEIVTYSSFDSGTRTITLSSGTSKAHSSGDKVVPIEGSTTNDVAYNAGTEGNKWSVTNLNGLLVATNGSDVPQKWPLTSSTGFPYTSGTSDPNEWANLTNWPGSNYKCKSIRAYKTFLIGLNWERAGLKEPRLVKWSHSAAYGTEPLTWDELDETKDAGEYELSDTPGRIVDGLQLGDSFMIYKNDSIYSMNYIGTPYIFSFKLLSNDAGLLSKNAVCEFEGGHFFMGNNDFYVCDGQNVTAILPNKVKHEIFDNISGTYYEQSYVVLDTLNEEILSCYPSGVSDKPDKAVVWNYRKNVFSFTDIPSATSIVSGKFEFVVDEDWVDADTSGKSWVARASDVWTTGLYDANLNNLIILDSANNKFYRANHGLTADGTTIESILTRESIDFDDPSLVKHVSAIYPKMQLYGSGLVNFSVGSQMSPEEPVKWQGPYTFDPASQSKISCRVSGKYISIKIESNTDLSWELNSIAYDVSIRGNRGSLMR